MIDGLVSRWTVLFLTAVVLQVGVVPQFPVLQVVGDMMLLLSVCAGVAGGPQRGAIVGFWAGLAFDLMRSTGPLGLSSLAYTLVGAAVGALMIQVLQMRRLLAVGVVSTGSAAGSFVMAFLGQIFGEHTLTDPRLLRIVGVVALLNGLFAPAVLPACRWAEREDEPQVLGRIDS